MSLFFKKNLAVSNILLIDINDFSFEAVIFSKRKGLDYTYKLTETLEKGVFLQESLEITVSNIEIQLERHLRKIVDKVLLINKKIDFCFISFSPIWRISQSHLVKIKKETSFIFTKNDFEEIFKNEDSSFFKKLKDNFDFKHVKIIETDITHVLLNGYETNSPFGKTAKTFEFHIIVSVIQKKLFDFINNLFKIRLNLSFEDNNLLLKSDVEVFFTVLKNFLPLDNSLLVNIGGETTEIIFIKNSYIEEIVGFNKGVDFFTRRVASSLKTSLSLAESNILRFYNDALEDNAREKLKKIFLGAACDFQKHFLDAVSEINTNYPLPQDLFVLSIKPLPQDLFVLKNQNGDIFFNIHKISLNEIFLKKEDVCYNNSSSSLCLLSVFLNKYLNYE